MHGNTPGIREESQAYCYWQLPVYFVLWDKRLYFLHICMHNPVIAAAAVTSQIGSHPLSDVGGVLGSSDGEERSVGVCGWPLSGFSDSSTTVNVIVSVSPAHVALTVTVPADCAVS